MRRLGLVLAAVLLTACSGGDDAPASSPELSAGPWPPPSVLTLEQPPLPPIDAPPTKATATKYVSYLIDEIDYALRTTYPDRVLRHGTDAWGGRCEVCDEVVEFAEAAQAARQRYEFDDWGGYLLLAREVAPQQADDPATYWRIRLMLWQPETRVLDDGGEVVDTMPLRNRETVLVIGVLAGEWRIFAWDFLDPAAPA